MADQESMFQRGPTLADVAAATLQPVSSEPTEEAAPDPVEEDQSEVTTADIEAADQTEGGEDQEDDLGGGEEPTEEEEVEEVEAYRVVIDGEESEATLEELIRSYQVNGAAHKRMQEVNKDRERVFEEARVEAVAKANGEIQAQMQTLEEQRQMLGQVASMFGERLFQPAVQKPDEALRQTDPIKYLTLSDAYRDDLQRLEGEKANLAAVFQKMNGQVEEQRETLRKQSQAQLLQQRPELREKDGQVAFTGRVRAAQEAVGFTQAEVDAYPDHRGLLVLEMAGRYLEMMEGQKPASAIIKKKTKTLKPGNSRPESTPGQKQRRADRERARKTGDPKDVAKLLVQPAPRR